MSFKLIISFQLYKRLCCCTIIFGTVLYVSPLSAKDNISEQKDASKDEDSIEHILVTSQKRVQSLTDVPISVSVYSGENIDNNVIANLAELTTKIPNVTINESGAGTNLFIRGVGSGVNLGFEQTVGTYIDGVYFGRARNARSALFDIERLEILKGPQDALFGKNGVAGALNITTRQPIDDYTGYLQIDAEPKFNGSGIKGGISVPISNELSTRLAIMLRSEDGWVYNTNIDGDERKKQDFLVRSTWLWQPTVLLKTTLKVEYGNFETEGRANVVSIFPETLATFPLVRAIDEDFSPQFGLEKSSGSGSELGTENANDETKLMALVVEYQFKNGKINSLTSFTSYQLYEQLDADYLPYDFLHVNTGQKHKQISQEFRYSSELKGKFNYILGAYYQVNDLNSIRELDINGFSLGQPFSGRRHNTFLQDTYNRSIFFQTNWQLDRNWQINTGLRYSQTKKTLYKNLYIADLLSDNVNNEPTANFVFRNNLNIIPHQFSNHSTIDGASFEFDPIRDEAHLSPSINVQYFTESDVMLYTSVAKSYKGGGFDEDNTAGNAEKEEYQDEEVIAYEVGVKADIGRQANISLSVFHSNYKDIQVSTFDGVTGFNVGNAAKSISQGVEIDTRWKINEFWYLNFSGAYLDAYYKDYRQGQCTVTKTNCNAQGVQDLSGHRLQFAPKWSGTLNISHSSEIRGDWLITANASVDYIHHYSIPGDLDPLLAQKAVAKIGARLQIGNRNDNWYLALTGKNLTNELTTSWGNDIPLAAGGYFQHVDAPRSVEFTMHWQF